MAPADPDADRREAVLRSFLEHQGMLRAYAFAIVGDWDVADEAVQETAVYVCAHWHELAAPGEFPVWARSVARLRALECRRRRPGGGDGLSLAGPLPGAAWGGAPDGEGAALARCVDELPHHLRQLVDWHYRDGVSGASIAGRLARTVEAVYMALTRVRRRLRDCVRRRLVGDAR